MDNVFAIFVRNWLEENDLNSVTAAPILKVNQTTVSAWTLGTIPRGPYPKLAKAFGIREAEFRRLVAEAKAQKALAEGLAVSEEAGGGGVSNPPPDVMARLVRLEELVAELLPQRGARGGRARRAPRPKKG